MNGFEEKYTEETLVKIYLDWVNNFLSVGRFAEYYGIDEAEALWAIERGRELNEAQCNDKGVLNMDYDPRDWGYEVVAKGLYVKEAYMKEFGGYVWQPMVLGWTASPESYVTRGEALAFLKGVEMTKRLEVK